MNKLIEKINQLESLKEQKDKLENNKEMLIEAANKKLELIKMAIKPYQIILKETNILSIVIKLPQPAYDSNYFCLKLTSEDVYVTKTDSMSNYCLQVTKSQYIQQNSNTLPYNLFVLNSNFISDWDITDTIERIKKEIIDNLETKILGQKEEIRKYTLAIQKFDVKNSKEIIVNALDTLFILNNLYQHTGELEIMDKIINQINYLEEVLKGGE